MTIQKKIGAFIKHHRQEKKMFQSELAKIALGDDRRDGEISKIEKGLRNLKIETLEKIFTSLDIDMSKMFDIVPEEKIDGLD